MNWYSVKVKYTKTLDDHKTKKVSESYMMQAANFGDAEQRIHTEIGSMIRGEFTVTNIAPVNINEVIGQYGTDSTDLWYKCKVSYNIGTEKKPKKITENYLVAGNSVKSADEALKNGLKSLMADYDISAVMSSPILDVFPLLTASQLLEKEAADPLAI
jgi:hypothetical protein